LVVAEEEADTGVIATMKKGPWRRAVLVLPDIVIDLEDGMAV
jgi:hypothetical protein